MFGVARILKVCLVVLWFLSLFGCASKQETVRIFWPALPNDPYLEWIGSYASQDDFEKTPAEKVMRDLLGQPKVQGFKNPHGIVGDSDRGLVYVTDGGLKNVRVYDFNKKKVALLTESTIFQLPVGLALDNQKNLYVCDARAGKVFVVSAEGQVLRTFGGEVLSKPTQLAINERIGRVYVSDVVKSEIAVFDLEGNYLFAIGQRGMGPTDLYAPQAIAIDSENKLYVADQLNARIQVYDAEGKHVFQFGKRGDKYYNFETPRGVAFDSDENLWVTDARKATVYAYDKKGKLLLVYDPSVKLSHYPLGLAFPTAIMFDHNDRMYLVDGINQRFQIWQFFSGKYKQLHPLTEEEKATQMRLLEEKQNTIW